MKVDDPGSASSSADSTTASDTVDETRVSRPGNDRASVSDSAKHHPMSREAMFAGASGGLEGAAEAPRGDAAPGRNADSSRPGAADNAVNGEGAVGAVDRAGTADGDAEGNEGDSGQPGTAEGTGPVGPAVEGTETAGATGEVLSDPPDSGRGSVGVPDEGSGLPEAETPREPALPREAGDDSGTRGEPGDLAGPRSAFAVIDGQADGRDGPGTDEAGTERKPEGRAAPARNSPEGTENASSDQADPQAEDAEKAEADKNDEPGEQDRKPLDVNPAQPDETGPETSPDARPDDQRPLTVAEAKALIAEVLAENNAKHEAELDEQKAKYEAEAEELKAGYESRISALEAKVEGDQEEQAEGQLPGDRTPEDEARPDAPDAGDERSAEQRGDRLQRGTQEPEQGPGADSFADQGSAIGDHEERADEAEVKKADSTRWRRIMTSENISATGTLGGAVNTVALFAMHATPEAGITVGLTILGLAGLVKAKIEKHRKDSNDRPD